MFIVYNSSVREKFILSKCEFDFNSFFLNSIDVGFFCVLKQKNLTMSKRYRVIHSTAAYEISSINKISFDTEAKIKQQPRRYINGQVSASPKSLTFTNRIRSQAANSHSGAELCDTCCTFSKEIALKRIYSLINDWFKPPNQFLYGLNDWRSYT